MIFFEKLIFEQIYWCKQQQRKQDKKIMKKEITIIGAGLVGSLLSIYLCKRGYKVKIFERRADMRKEKMSACDLLTWH